MWTRTRFQCRAGAILLGLAVAGAAGASASKPARAAGPQDRVPSSVAAEHRALHEELARVIESGGRTAATARAVEQLLQPHFAKEEQFALPPLAVLAGVASGKVPPNAAEIIRMSDTLKNDMPAMLAEHAAIGKALERLRAAAQEEHKQDAVQFAEHLKAHAKQEEEILYPAAVIAGQYLKLKSR